MFISVGLGLRGTTADTLSKQVNRTRDLRLRAKKSSSAAGKANKAPGLSINGELCSYVCMCMYLAMHV